MCISNRKFVSATQQQPENYYVCVHVGLLLAEKPAVNYFVFNSATPKQFRLKGRTHKRAGRGLTMGPSFFGLVSR